MKTLITLSLLLIVQAAHAFYEPTLGRWINRDPITEIGGINLYGYVDNDPISHIDPSGLTLESNWKFFWDWVFERGESDRSYGEGTVELAEMKTSPGAARMRATFKAGNCKNIRNGSFGTVEGYFKTGWRVNDTSFQVGGFLYDATDNGDGTATYTIRNQASAYSFFLHIPFLPHAERGGRLHFFGNINQVFQWAEQSPCCKEKK